MNYYIEQLNDNYLNTQRNKLWFDLITLGIDNNSGNNAYQQLGYISKLFNIFKINNTFCITATIEYHCFESNNVINEETFLNPLVSIFESELNMYNVSNIMSYKYNNSICSCKICNKSQIERETNLNCSKDLKIYLYLIF